MKNMVSPDELINVTVINLHRNTISRPSLKEDFLLTRTFLTSHTVRSLYPFSRCGRTP